MSRSGTRTTLGLPAFRHDNGVGRRCTARTKSSLRWQSLMPGGFAILNRDSAEFARLDRLCLERGHPVITYGTDPATDIAVLKVAVTNLTPIIMTDSDNLQVGDLVFFNTRNYSFSHVGLYLGDNRFIHAPKRGRDVEITTLSREYWQRHFNGARRLVGVLPSLIPSVIPEAFAATLSTVRAEPADEPQVETPELPGAP